MTLLTLYDNAMLRGPRSVPVVGRLGGGVLATVSEGQPFRAVGAQAVAYQLRQPSGKVVALRCWLDDQIPEGAAERYRALGVPETLKRLHEVARSPVVRSISFHADGVSIESENLRSESRPVVALDWVMGPTLLAAVDRACRARDKTYLVALSNAWRTAVEAAETVGFVHGDLAPDNAIVRPQEGIAFIDYDTAYWPEAPSIPELDPTPAYRHPRGISSDPERADDFAALVIFASLRILAVWPELREENGQPATVKGAGLLFQPRDLSNPDGSLLFGKLRVLDEPFIQGLVAIVREACLADPDEAPSFGKALELAGKIRRGHDPIMPAAPDLPPAHHPTWPHDRPESHPLHRRPRPTDLALDAGVPAPVQESWPKRQPTWRPERVAALADAIGEGDLALAEEQWSLCKAEAGAGALLPALELLRTQTARTNARTSETGELKSMRADARRNEIRHRLVAALDQDDHEELADLALSGDLDEVEDLGEASTRRIVAALAMSHLDRAIASDDDLLIVEAFDEGVLGGAGHLTAEQRNRVDLAFERRGWLDDMRKAIRRRKLDRIETLLAEMPTAASDRLTEREIFRIDRLRAQFDALETLRRAIAQGSDADIVHALHAVEQIGAPIPPDLAWSEIANVIDRYSLIMSIRRAAESQPRDVHRLSRLLPQLREMCGGDFPRYAVELDLNALDHEVKQMAQVARVRQALSTNDDRAIVASALPDVYGAIPLLSRSEQARIERAVAAVNRALRRSGQRSNKDDSSETEATITSGSEASSSS